MLKTDIIVDYLKENGKTSFKKIWDDLESEILSNINDSENAEIWELKSNVYLSMIQDFNLIMIGGNVWDAKESYSLEQIEKINNSLYENLEDLSENEVDLDKIEEEKEFKDELHIIEDEVSETIVETETEKVT